MPRTYTRKAKEPKTKLIPIPVSYAEASSGLSGSEAAAEPMPEPEEIADGTLENPPPPTNGHDADPETEIAERIMQVVADQVAADAEPQREAAALPIHIELPSQCRRVREQVLPAWYLARYTTHQNDPTVADQIMTMNAALSTADQAMMNQDVGQMIFITRILQQFAV